jgi:hypothetical protein
MGDPDVPRTAGVLTAGAALLLKAQAIPPVLKSPARPRLHYRTVVQLPVAVNADPVSAKFVRCVCDCEDGVRPGMGERRGMQENQGAEAAAGGLLDLTNAAVV